MKSIFIILAALFTTGAALGQNNKDRQHIVKQTNVEALNAIAEKYQALQAKFQIKNAPAIKVDKHGNKNYFSHYEADGSPIYYQLGNESSAISSRINEIRSGGSAGLDLDGSDLVIGLWDSGNPRTTHQELIGKIIRRDITNFAGHSTHVAGILVAEGIIPEARGMATSAIIESFTTGGWLTEVPLWASEGGMITNHSYIIGNPQEDYQRYGIYNVHSQNWDAISYNAPYLIMCTGASNNGNNGFNPDGSRYDLLASNKLGKNAIVVGACEDVLEYTGPESVRQAVFTSWGPTDDWRIKPDLAAVGTDNFSPRELSDTDYRVANGSSLAGPIVAGGLALLQQHYHNLNGNYMKAVTAKALIFSTTDEAGEFDGPDFSNGWGLFNARKAADVITNNKIASDILELRLTEGQTYTRNIETDGTQALSVAIVWNDPPSEPLPSEIHNDPTPMLINDLDVRLISENGVEYFPWRMEPNEAFNNYTCLLYTSPSPRDATLSRMPSSA